MKPEPTPAYADLFPAAPTPPKPAPVRLGLRIVKANPPVPVKGAPAALKDGCCPQCGRQLQFAAEGDGEKGWNRFDCRIKVVLHDPKNGAVRIKCPDCKTMCVTS